MTNPILLLLLYFINLISCQDYFQFDDIRETSITVNTTNETSIRVQHFTPRDQSSEGLQEFTPIRDTIVQSETKYYSFSVNTQSGLGEFYELLIFLSGNICTQPRNMHPNDTSLAVYYSFNASMFTNNEIGQMQLFQDGFFQALTQLPVAEDSDGPDILYIAVRAPENTNRTSLWTYQIGVSQNDLVFQWDDRSWGALVDADDNSALITTGNISSLVGANALDVNISESQFSLYLFSDEYKDYFNGLNNSWCAIRNGPVLIHPEDIETSITNRHGTLQQQFLVTGLNASTTYIAYIIMDFEGVEFGGAVYRPFQFETMSGDACELIYDLEFCDQVAYSVPALGDRLNDLDDNKNYTKKLYDDYARSLYVNFSKSLQQVACDTSPDAVFSNLRTCDDCADSYKNWLCAVTIPRCSSRNQTGYILRNATNQRNDFLADTINPISEYYEVLPCVNVCYAIVRDCPADFGFMCPTKNDSIKLSYYWDAGDPDDQWPSCNYVGHFSAYANRGFKAVINWSLLFVFLFIQMVL
ncbi:Stretch-activated cation channel MID1 [Candida viswanathii]|uniref:Stretch-activated cation channel MID1 n=1 Tax=Candida viswanathii TaxID=5486 RepID=A0A367YGT3_9ASCO|nr:Stretch-activated cation channel MID1 [Candida viswanathii]